MARTSERVRTDCFGSGRSNSIPKTSSQRSISGPNFRFNLYRPTRERS